MTPVAEGVSTPARRGLTVIIPSKNFSNLIPCVEAVVHHEPWATILIIDDGLEINLDLLPKSFLDHQAHIHLLDGFKPFIFARNCNLGIVRAGDDDVVLLNDDAILETPFGFRNMQDLAARYSDIGLVSATTNHAGNPLQHKRPGGGWRYLAGKTPGNSFPTVAFVCVLIPRRTIELIQMLDERFTEYGWEDNDYCRRLHNVEKRIVVDDGCFVDHSKLVSSYRGGPALAGQLEAGRQIYLSKWGSF